jgi:GxxExxY protein
MDHQLVSVEEDRIARNIVAAAYKVHTKLGPGLLEGLYEVCFCHELEKIGLASQRQLEIPIIYDGMKLPGFLRLDVLVEDLIICGLKAVERINEVYMAQLLIQLKLTGKRLGFLINFNVPLIKSGIKRLII